MPSPVTWQSLSGYAKAVNAFTHNNRPMLRCSSFAAVSSMDMSDLPEIGMFRASDGHWMAYRCHGPASSADASLAVVLVHGAGCFGDQMHALAAAMAEGRGCHVYTLDMRGHGLSEGRRGHAVNEASAMVRDVSEFVRALRTQPAQPRVVVGGHSAGGGLVLALARSKAAADVAGFLFVAPFLGLGSGVERPHFGGWVALRPWSLRLLALANLLGITAFNDRTVLDFNVAAAAPDPRYVSGWSFSTLLAFGPGPWVPGHPPIDTAKPVLVLAGSRDECFVHHLYRETFASIAPHASIPEIGALGHWDVLVDQASLAEATRWLLGFPETALRISSSPSAPYTPLPDARDPSPAQTQRARWWRREVVRMGAAVLLVAVPATMARAQEAPPAPPFASDRAYVRLGAAGIIFEPDATFRFQGQKVPGAQLGLTSNATVAGEAGYYITPHISLSVTGGLPPKTHVYGEGSIAPLGLLGSVRYGTILGLADYHFGSICGLRPWVGAGPAFLLVLSSRGSAIQDLKVSNRWGVAVQFGADYMLTPRWGIFASATENFVGSEGQGTYGPYAVQTKFTLNPVALQAGLELRF